MGSVTKTARAEEEERLARLGRFQQEEIPRFRLLVLVLLLLVTTSTILLDALHLFSSVFFSVADEEEHRKENKVEMNFFSIVSTLI